MLNCIAYHTYNLRDEVRKGRNPFTGETVEFPMDTGLTEAERNAVKALLAGKHASGPDEDGFHNIPLSDGNVVSLWTGDLDGSAPSVAFQLQFEGPATREILDLAREIAVRGNLTIGSTFDPEIVALVNPPLDPQIRRRWPKAMQLQTQEDFDDWVRDRLEIEVD
jgi:hypothetical protein